MASSSSPPCSILPLHLSLPSTLGLRPQGEPVIFISPRAKHRGNYIQISLSSAVREDWNQLEVSTVGRVECGKDTRSCCGPGLITHPQGPGVAFTVLVHTLILGGSGQCLGAVVTTAGVATPNPSPCPHWETQGAPSAPRIHFCPQQTAGWSLVSPCFPHRACSHFVLPQA